jgi:hypothetical protein
LFWPIHQVFDCALATYEEERSSAARPGRTVSSYFIFAEFLAVGDVPQYDLFPYGTEQNGSLLKTGKHENRNFDCLAGITYRLVMSSLEQEHNARRGVGVGIFPIEFERPFNVGARLGNPGGDDRDDSITRQPFHEQISQIGLYQTQCKNYKSITSC